MNKIDHPLYKKQHPVQLWFPLTEILLRKGASLQGDAITAHPSEKNLYHGKENNYRTPDVC